MILLSTVLLFSYFLHTADSEDCKTNRGIQRAASDPTALGYYEVQCEEEDESKYKQQQCWLSTGRCWCVDKYGKTIPDSHVNPGQSIDCKKFGWCKSAELKLMKGLAENGETMPPMGMYTPSCDDNGNFVKGQQWGSTGQSWCVVENGNRVPGTLTGPTEKSWDCENLPACLAKEASLAHLLVDGIYPFGLHRPACDGEGNFKPEQCHGSTGECWCVDKLTGGEMEDTRRSHDAEGGYVDCAQIKEKSLFNAATATPCQKLSNVQQEHLNKQEFPLLGFWTVSCLPDGSFDPSQCHPSTGHCWCVDKFGTEILGSRSLPGAPRMPCDKKPPKCSERKSMLDKESENFMLIGMFSPECEEDGSYKSKQCWGSTGQCWCVTKDAGTEIVYTRRGPTEEAHLLDCSAVSQPPPVPRGVGRLRDDPGSADEEAVSGGGSSTSLIVVIAILACLLVVVVVAGVVFFKRRNRNGGRYKEVNTGGNPEL